MCPNRNCPILPHPPPPEPSQRSHARHTPTPRTCQVSIRSPALWIVPRHKPAHETTQPQTTVRGAIRGVQRAAAACYLGQAWLRACGGRAAAQALTIRRPSSNPGLGMQLTRSRVIHLEKTGEEGRDTTAARYKGGKGKGYHGSTREDNTTRVEKDKKDRCSPQEGGRWGMGAERWRRQE